MPAFRKRTYAATRFGASNGTRMFKKRRFTRRRRTNRSGGRKTTDYTSLNTRGHAVGFRGRKTSRRAYKRHIWNSTVFKAHYRSILTLSTGFATPTGTNNSFVQFFNMYETTGTGGSPFWTVAGGAQEIDLGDGVPTFGDEIILRGGKFELTVTNQATSTQDDIKVKIYRMTTGNNPDFTTYFPGPLTPIDQAWDPSVVPDMYTQIGKPYLAREVLLKEGESYTFVTRFKSQKIDQDAYTNQSRSPFILVQYGNVGNSSPHSLEIKRSYNLSFSGDTV